MALRWVHSLDEGPGGAEDERPAARAMVPNERMGALRVAAPHREFFGATVALRREQRRLHRVHDAQLLQLGLLIRRQVLEGGVGIGETGVPALLRKLVRGEQRRERRNLLVG